LVADAVPEEQRGEAYGLFGAAMNAGFVLGPALGGVLGTLGYTSVFVGSCVFRLIALGLVLTLVRGAGPAPAAASVARAGVVRALLARPLVGAYILNVGTYAFFGFDVTLWALWLHQHLGATIALIGLSYAVWSGPNIIGSPLGGRLADRWPRSSLILIFGLAQVPLYVAYGLVSSLAPLLLLFALHGAVAAFMQPAVDATVATAAPPAARARAQGVYGAVGLAGAFLAASGLSTLYAVNYRLPLFALAAVVGVCTLTGGTLVRRAERDRRVPVVHPTPAVVPGR
jgi:DHA1 family tetracycline resistance protein-like MFS transporter